MELLSDIAGYGFFYDPALDLWNIALSSFNSADKLTSPLRTECRGRGLFFKMLTVDAGATFSK